MNRYLAQAALCCLLLLTPVARAEPPGPDAWTLVFRDEFDGTTADLGKHWNFQNGPSGHILCSRWRENAVGEKGMLRLLNKKEERGGQHWTSASLWTKQPFVFGYFEARYRYGDAPGLNNSFWLTTRLPKGAHGRHEIDINEGHHPDEVNTNIHRWSGKHWAKGQAFRMKGLPLSREFHVYGLEWTPRELIWYFDGKEIRRERNTVCHLPAPVFFSSAVMKWAGPVTDRIHGTSMDVDWVRVYRRKAPEKKGDPMDLAALIQPVPTTAKFSHPDFFIWGASMVRADDGTCRLLYSRWPRKLGHNAWVTHSEIAHAVAKNPLGPYQHADVALPARGKQFWDGLCTHNPTVHRFGDKYYLYYMGNTGDGGTTKDSYWLHRNNQRIGVAVADSPAGPWSRFDQPAVDVSTDPDAHDALMTSNPAACQRPDGSILMVYKAVAKKGKGPFYGPVVHCVATAKTPTGPFVKHPEPVFTVPGEHFPAEDPSIWYQADRGRYYAIVKDFKGHFTGAGTSLALFESADGIDWRPSKHVLVTKLVIPWAGGSQKVAHLERPQLWLDRGRPAALFRACDLIGANRAHSFNVHFP
ncbi:family 16 glycosylhydrolase, partial [bacterium]|nr:family 16 glycosylhydrolase [bacterium]